MRRSIVVFVVALGLTALSAGPSGAESLGPICWHASGQRLNTTFSLVFLTNASSNAVVTVAGVHVPVSVQDPNNPLPVSGAAFRDDNRNSIKMILTIAATAATESAGGPVFVEFSLDPPHGGQYRLSGPPSGDQLWTLVPCSSIN
jgi:hypothetical protein